MRPALLALLLLAACAEEPLDLTIPTLPGATHLLMSDSGAGTKWLYRMKVESRVRQQVRLEATLEEPAPEGVSVRIAERTEVIPREGTGEPILVVAVPPRKGPFRGALVIASPDVPGWSMRYTFEGEVVREGLRGKNLAARNPGADLGRLGPGDERTLAVALAAVGDEPVVIKSWEADDLERVRLPRAAGPVTVSPGGEFQLPVTVVAPRTAGPFEARVRVESDATSHRNGLVLQFRGEVVPDYAPNPPRAVETAAYPAQQPEFKVMIRAREGVPPFTVAQVQGHERYFEVLSRGTDSPAMEQLVTMRLRRDAPTDPARDAEWQVRFRVEPGGVEVSWPVKIRLNPPIHAQPTSIDFREVPSASGMKQDILLAVAGNRAFRVLEARAERRQVEVRVAEHTPGSIWRVIVSVPKGLAPGPVDDRVVIDTDDPDVPRLIVPVKGEVR